MLNCFEGFFINILLAGHPFNLQCTQIHLGRKSPVFVYVDYKVTLHNTLSSQLKIG